MADFCVDFGNCAFDCRDSDRCYDKDTTGVGGDGSKFLKFDLKDGSGRNLIED